MKKLLACITFHFNPARLVYLQQATQHFEKLTPKTTAIIITNDGSADAYDQIQECLSQNNLNYEIRSPGMLGHPYLLPWCHFSVFREKFSTAAAPDYFLYMEDDLHITQANLDYWMKSRELLRSENLIPSFVRFEYKKGSPTPFATDAKERTKLETAPKLYISKDYCFINLPRPYQGMYLLDKELMHEHLFGNSSSPEFGTWGIREKAAQGLTFANIPMGFSSRTLVGYSLKEQRVDPDCLVHHIPNNYANNPNSRFGKIPVSEIVFKSNH